MAPGVRPLSEAQVAKAVQALLKFVGDQDKQQLLEDDELLYLVGATGPACAGRAGQGRHACCTSAAAP